MHVAGGNGVDIVERGDDNRRRTVVPAAIPELALNFEMSMFRVPSETFEDVEANYYDWNIHGTFNVNRYVGLQVGWRRLTNFLVVEDDSADVKFQGLWFGGALRY